MSRYKRYERYKDSGVEWIGEIPEHWNNKKISWIFNIIGSGTTPSTSNLEYYDGDVPWVNTGDLNDGYLYETSKMITDLALKDYSTLKFYPIDTLLIAMYGATIGKLSITKIIATTNQACCALAQPKNVNIKFIFYWFLANRNHIIAMAYGGGQPNISQNLIKSLRINLPEKHEQNAIVNFLDQKTAVIDGLIADKEKLIELLQEKRQAIITEAVTKGLNPNVRMKDSGIEWIGEIPEHWGVEPIKYLVKTIQTGTTPTTKNDDYFDGDIQWFTPGDFQGSKELYESSRKISNRAIIDNEARLFPKNTVMIVGIGATVGKVAKLGIEGSFNQQITGLIVNEQRLNCDYLYYWLYINQETIKNISNYTTLPIINNEFVKNFECLSLPLDEQQAIVNYLNQKTSEIDDLILKIRLQIQKLKEYRQSLISEAVTGKIDVREFGSISEVI